MYCKGFHVFVSCSMVALYGRNPIPKKVNKLVNIKIVNLEMEVGIKR